VTYQETNKFVNLEFKEATKDTTKFLQEATCSVYDSEEFPHSDYDGSFHPVLG